MNPIRTLKTAGGVVAGILGAIVWTLATIWFGLRLVLQGVRLVRHARTLAAQTTRCRRGHRVPLYGVFVCSSCKATSEGYLFRPCRYCGNKPTWIHCPKCRLSVGDPWRFGVRS